MALTNPVFVGGAGNNNSVTIGKSPNRNIEVGEFLVVALSERD